MKKYILFFLFLSAFASLCLLFPGESTDDFVSVDKNKFKKDDFVSIGKHSFQMNGKDFFPVTVNYMVHMQTDGKDFWARPAIDYTADTIHENKTKETCLKELGTDFKLIKQLGFNSVRVISIGEVKIENDSDRFSPISFGYFAGDHNVAYSPLADENSYKKYFETLSQLLNEANNAGLKVILVVRIRPQVFTTEFFLDRITKYFRNDATLMAYDLFNEPLYFDKQARNKEEINVITRRWKKLCHQNAPHQLMTIGLEGIREAFAWDPSIINVDFVSFHPYEHEPDQVRNEIYWYSKHVNKPWVIGETSIPADNDSIKYDEQKLFAHKTLVQAHNCGAWGYSWWQYKDVRWKTYHSRYMGVVNWNGETHVQNENLAVYGTVKPVAEEFKNFDPATVKGECACLTNYYNYSQFHDSRIKGRLVDEKNNPVEGGVIMAWDKSWVMPYHTITKADGSFELLGNVPFYHWIASANAHSMIRGELLPDTAKQAADKIPTLDLGDLKIKTLPFGD